MWIVDFTVYRKFREHTDDRISRTWNQESGVFSWGLGSVRVPRGFEHKAEPGIDTFVGSFTSQVDGLEIRYDIGELAGEHGGMNGSESLIRGARVRSVRASSFAIVSFPDTGCATFSLETSDPRQALIIDGIGQSFQPADWKPAWLRPLLPEILRSDCRQRFRMPFE